MIRNRKFFFLLFCVIFFALAVPAYAAVFQAALAPTPGFATAQKIIVIAGVVAALLQGAKKIFPQINGKVAVTLSVLASLAAAYAVAAPGDVLSVNFFITTVGAALGANGIYSFLGPQPAPPPIVQSPVAGAVGQQTKK
jgi:hypothetical protein